MKCQYCSCEESKVIDSRSNEENNTIRRRRECLKCGKRFTTYEYIEISPILVIKNNGIRQPFDPGKIKKGIVKACEKRQISMDQIDKIVADIEKHIQNSLKTEIKSSTIGELIMAKLKELDEIAYIRFASVYRKFKDVTTLMKFINEN